MRAHAARVLTAPYFDPIPIKAKNMSVLRGGHATQAYGNRLFAPLAGRRIRRGASSHP
jgi:hypothetical protein